ncbi:MAG: hypothetical protein VYE73_06240 [Acidobacteriota bacterium]|nr:hypothetical protein [Acidobacteriota bacterium]
MSDDRDRERQGFRVIRGGLKDDPQARDSVQIVMGPRAEPPFPIDALVREEDTYLVLSGEPGANEQGSDHPIRVMTALLDVEPKPPGTIVVRERTPLEILAIVHDLGEEPTWNEGWVTDALVAVVGETERRELSHVGLETLGAVHGGLGRPRFLQLLRHALRRADPRHLEKVWIIAPE